MVGYSGKWVREIERRYEAGGVDALGDRRHGNPGAKERALLDEAGEEELVEALSGAPPGGGLWSGPKVARWIKERNGLEKVHVQRGFEYLRKVGMSPQVPRPSNAKGADSSEREAFKKSRAEAGEARGGPPRCRSAVVGGGRDALGPKAGEQEGVGADREEAHGPLQERIRVDLPLRLPQARKRRGLLDDPAHSEHRTVLFGARGVRKGGGSRHRQAHPFGLGQGRMAHRSRGRATRRRASGVAPPRVHQSYNRRKGCGR